MLFPYINLTVGILEGWLPQRWAEFGNRVVAAGGEYSLTLLVLSGVSQKFKVVVVCT